MIETKAYLLLINRRLPDGLPNYERRIRVEGELNDVEAYFISYGLELFPRDIYKERDEFNYALNDEDAKVICQAFTKSRLLCLRIEKEAEEESEKYNITVTRLTPEEPF